MRISSQNPTEAGFTGVLGRYLRRNKGILLGEPLLNSGGWARHISMKHGQTAKEARKNVSRGYQSIQPDFSFP